MNRVNLGIFLRLQDEFLVVQPGVRILQFQLEFFWTLKIPIKLHEILTKLHRTIENRWHGNKIYIGGVVASACSRVSD